MTQHDPIRNHIETWLTDRLAAEGRAVPKFEPTLSLVGHSLLDSLGFLDLVAELEGEFGFEIDFSTADPESFVTLAGLTQLCHSSVRRAA